MWLWRNHLTVIRDKHTRANYSAIERSYGIWEVFSGSEGKSEAMDWELIPHSSTTHKNGLQNSTCRPFLFSHPTEVQAVPLSPLREFKVIPHFSAPQHLYFQLSFLKVFWHPQWYQKEKIIVKVHCISFILLNPYTCLASSPDSFFHFKGNLVTTQAYPVDAKQLIDTAKLLVPRSKFFIFLFKQVWSQKSGGVG